MKEQDHYRLSVTDLVSGETHFLADIAADCIRDAALTAAETPEDLWELESRETEFQFTKRQHDIHALHVLLPGWELLGDLPAHAGAPDPEPERLSYPYAYKTAFEMELDGTCWFRVWDATGGLSVDDETGITVDPGLPLEEAAGILHAQMLAFMRGKFPEDR